MKVTAMSVGGPGNGGGEERAAAGASLRAADLAACPKLVVINLGHAEYAWRGLPTVLRLRSEIHKALGQPPDGLLLHESFYFSFLPLRIGLRQYWRDFDSLERWTRSFPHHQWWKEFARDGQGTGFWYETYLVESGVEGIHDGMPESVGLLHFAPSAPPAGKRLFALRRLGLDDPSESGEWRGSVVASLSFFLLWPPFLGFDLSLLSCLQHSQPFFGHRCKSLR